MFVRPSEASFIEQDLKLLSKHYEVRTMDVFEKGRSLGNRVRVFWRMFWGVLRSDITYSWFAEVYALWAVRLSRRFHKKSIVVIGGYEVAQVPEISYGSALHPETREMVSEILSKASKSIAVSEFVKRSAKSINDAADIEVVYNAVDVEALVPTKPKMEIVVTVGGATRQRLVLKGMDVFVSASTKVPGTKFVVIGPFDQQVVDELLKVNLAVEFTGELPRERLTEWLDKAKVYCQLSRVESFGFALAEAMSMECIPVVSDQGALPEVVGEEGFVVPYGDADAAAEAINKALHLLKGHEARTRIAERFSVDKREKELCRLIDSLVSR